MSLYGDYIKAREGREIIEDEDGFATYKIFGEECYIADVYVRPESRKNLKSWKYIDQIREIAREKGCKCLTTTVVPVLEGSTFSTMAILQYGFRLHSSKENMIIFVKEL